MSAASGQFYRNPGLSPADGPDRSAHSITASLLVTGPRVHKAICSVVFLVPVPSTCLPNWLLVSIRVLPKQFSFLCSLCRRALVVSSEMVARLRMNCTTASI